jgi:signal transduction histidine kinase
MRLVFLVIFIINLMVAAHLFFSTLNSPLALVVIRVVIMVIVLGFLVSNSFRHPEITGRGWYAVLAGFLLLLLEPVTMLVTHLPPLASWLNHPQNQTLAIFQELFFRLLGFFFLAYGFFLWIPSIIEARRKAAKTAELLERKVAERTSSLDSSNRELELSKARLEEAARLKNEFLASFSHELKTPLNSILGFCRLLKEKSQGPLNEKQLKSISIIDENSKGLLERINHILDFAKMEFEKIEPVFRDEELGPLFNETGHLFEPGINRKGLQFSTDTELATVCTDRKLLGQVLQAALDNAIKFTDRGKINVTARPGTDPERWELLISDTGEGIGENDLPYIFEAFRQGDGSLSRRHGGTGLGLTIVRRITDLLQGRIEVDSTPGSGTTLCFSFPRRPGGATKARTDAAADPDEEIITGSGGKDELQV